MAAAPAATATSSVVERRGLGRLGRQAGQAEKRQRRDDRAERKDAEQVHRAVVAGVIGMACGVAAGMIAVEIAAVSP